jgi:hypothetical protein
MTRTWRRVVVAALFIFNAGAAAASSDGAHLYSDLNCIHTSYSGWRAIQSMT